MANENKKGLSTNSNTYTIIYAIVMVVIVAFLLSFVFSVLRDRQDQNERLDKKAQILGAINVNDADDVQAAYGKYVKKAILVDAEGNEKEGDGFEIDFTKTQDDQNMPLYVCDVDGSTKYIVPLRGNGLWGPIWGYVGLNDDKNTIYGIYFAHESETPGLGAEIVTDGFRTPFKDKHIKDGNNTVVSVAVKKKGQTEPGREQVDAISGGTITSTAVDNMLKECLTKYEKFLTK